MRKPLFKHTHIVKLSRLLNMLYKPGEIAEEIGVAPDTVYRSYLPAGLPHRRDAHGNIWIHGPAFAAWAREVIQKHRAEHPGIPADHAWCLGCKGPVLMVDPQVIYAGRGMEVLQSACPGCGRPVNRARGQRAGGAK